MPERNQRRPAHDSNPHEKGADGVLDLILPVPLDFGQTSNGFRKFMLIAGTDLYRVGFKLWHEVILVRGEGERKQTGPEVGF